jgi:hypothetical protein
MANEQWLYVRGIKNLQEDQVRTAFSQHGTVLKVDMKKSRRGFGFVMVRT